MGWCCLAVLLAFIGACVVMVVALVSRLAPLLMDSLSLACPLCDLFRELWIAMFGRWAASADLMVRSDCVLAYVLRATNSHVHYSHCIWRLGCLRDWNFGTATRYHHCIYDPSHMCSSCNRFPCSSDTLHWLSLVHLYGWILSHDCECGLDLRLRV